MMKNKLQQLFVLTLITVILIFIFYLYVPYFIYLTVITELFSLIVCISLIFFDERNTTSKFSWILAILMFPYLGIISFILIGRNPKSRKFSIQQTQNELAIQKYVKKLIRSQNYVQHLNNTLPSEIFKLSGKSPVVGNQIDVFHDGNKAFTEILKDIQSASHHIHVFYFIIKGDSTGEKLLKLLAEKAKQGVIVRLMYDSVGSIKLPYDLIRYMKESGVETRVYDLVNSPLLSTRVNWRNHRKMIVIDGKIAHVGGMNIGDEYLSKTKEFNYWRDTNIRMMGLSVIEVQEIFLYDWFFLNTDIKAETFLKQSEYYFPTTEKKLSGETIQVIYGGPYDSERIIKDAIINIIGKARRSIKIAMPYFVPDEDSLAVLRRAARCGIKIQLIIPGKGDRGISFHGTNSFIDRLLDVGIEVFFYNPNSFIHCKVIIVDDEIATIGSTNFDIRSFHLNHELSVFIYGPSETVNKLNQQFERDLECSISVYNYQQKKSTLTIINEKLSKLFIPLL
ncbi:cardiolipin synthase [Enterococcus casseliflavus]|nr:cardiolipin synthase [Enterococcus casseliflavus]